MTNSSGLGGFISESAKIANRRSCGNRVGGCSGRNVPAYWLRWIHMAQRSECDRSRIVFSKQACVQRRLL